MHLFIYCKVIAIFVGPSGMALLGNLRNFLTSTEAFATLGFENGVVKYVAEHKKEEQKLQQTLSTILILDEDKLFAGFYSKKSNFVGKIP